MQLSYPLTIKHRFKVVLTTITILGCAFLPFGLQIALAETSTSIQSQLLNDDNFVAALKQKLGKQEVDKTAVQEIMKTYLLENPEFLLQVEQALTDQQQKKMAASQTATIDSMKDEIFNSKQDIVLGNPLGKVTLVEFFDYNCGYCRRSLPDIMTLVKQNNNLRLVLKDFPILGEDSVKAHIVARAFYALEPEKYAQFFQQVMTAKGRATEASAIKVAVSLGANEAQLRAKMRDSKIQDPFKTNAKIAYQLNINGTPSYVLGHEVIVGAVEKSTLEEKLDKLNKGK